MASKQSQTVDNQQGPWSVVDTIGQSAPVDLSRPYSTESLAGKTILITGGASGFGAAFAREWASKGSHIMIGDVNDERGHQLVAELRMLPGSSRHHHYQRCDVTSWADQVALFKAAVQASPTGGIDAVVASAGIGMVGGQPGFDNPGDLDQDPPPPPPPLHVLDVNLTGVMYTAHLALFWLPKNEEKLRKGGEEEGFKTTPRTRDRHLLLVSSVAGLSPLPGATVYSVSKHAVLGLFRTLRATVRHLGIRCNVLCPYFVDTPILPAAAMLLLAGGAKAEIPDVVDAATRLMADESIVGRGLAIGPKMPFGCCDVDVDGLGEGEADGSGKGANGGALGQQQQAVWEVHAHDYERVEVFIWRFVTALNVLKEKRGVKGLVKDLFLILTRPWRLKRQ